jgi:hypothetical protein
VHRKTAAGLGRVLLAFIIFVALFRAAEAQTLRCAIRGAVFDQSGVAISWAVVKVENRASGHAYATVASQAGEYWFRDLPAGSYLVTALSPGFRILQVPSATIQAGATGVLPLKLSRAVNATKVEVNASAGDSRTTMAARKKERGRAANVPSWDLSQSHLTDLFESDYTLCN